MISTPKKTLMPSSTRDTKSWCMLACPWPIRIILQSMLTHPRPTKFQLKNQIHFRVQYEVLKKYNLAHPCIYFVFLKMTLHYRLISFKMTKFECISRWQIWISCMKQSLTILNVTFTTKYIYDFSNFYGGIIFTIYTLECTWNGSLIHSRYHYSYSTLLL
jgi:hypothetical protein